MNVVVALLTAILVMASPQGAATPFAKTLVFGASTESDQRRAELSIERAWEVLCGGEAAKPCAARDYYRVSILLERHRDLTGCTGDIVGQAPGDPKSRGMEVAEFRCNVDGSVSIEGAR